MVTFLQKHGDFIGRLGIAIVFSASAALQIRRLGSAWSSWRTTGNLTDLLGILAAIALLAFLVMVVTMAVVRHKPIDSADGWEPRVSALTGTYLILLLPMFPPSFNPPPALTIAALLVSLIGGALCAYVISFLGKSFSIMAEARKLVTDGPYRLVRHPLYLAELVMTLGGLLLTLSFGATLITCMQWLFQLRRMTNEEEVLRKNFPDYASYASQTPKVLPTTESLQRFFARS